MISYPARITYDDVDKIFNVEFPDLEGCLTFGESLESAIESAKEALTGYLSSLDNRNIKLPESSTMAENDIYRIIPHKNVAFAIWLKLKRTEKGFTQKEMAEQLRISYQSYQRYENPETANPTLKRLEQIEEVLHEEIVAV